MQQAAGGGGGGGGSVDGAARAAKPSTGAPYTGSLSVELFSRVGCAGESVVAKASHDESRCERCFDFCSKEFPSGAKTHDGVRSLRVVASGGAVDPAWSVSAYRLCAGEFHYPNPDLARRGMRPTDGCVSLSGATGKPINLIQFDGMPDLLQSEATNTYHIAYSAESSTYFGFQAYANLYAFQGSNQMPGTGYTRLLTAGEPDDLTDIVPTFQAPRHPLSRRYTPYNKPDVVAKWFESGQGPKEDVIVIIDPDNWLLTSVAKTASQVRPGHAIAQAAFFNNNPLVDELFKLVCERNCDFKPDDAAVPYFVHREDLRKIAPLWRDITAKLLRMQDNEPKLNERFRGIQLDWCVEMYGYVFAAAELGIKHTIKGMLQIRDVDSPPPPDQEKHVPMVHMGRIWFPKRHAEFAEQWRHTEGRTFAYRGIQVWCKCNWTASHVIPWPIPEGTDFASRQTLRILHDSMVKFGPLPKSKYRGGPTRVGYHRNFP